MAFEVGPVSPMGLPALAPLPAVPPPPPPAPAAPQLDVFLPQAQQPVPLGAVAPGVYPYPPQPLGQDLRDLGEAGARVVGHVGQGVWNGTKWVADGVADAAPHVGNAIANGTEKVVDGVAVAAPVVGRAVANGADKVVDGVVKHGPTVGRGVMGFFGKLSNGIASVFRGIGNAFRRDDRWQGPAIVVQPGDSLGSIAQRTLGDARRWPEIYEWNRDLVVDPNRLQAGTMLRLPPYIDMPGQQPYPVPAPAPAPKPSPAPAGSYTVVKGDTLIDLSRRFLGDESRWQEIYALNKDKIQDPHWIYPGQVLLVPRR